MPTPFGAGSKIEQTFLLLQDMQWHCGKHELPGTQPAKAIQIIRQHGYDIENSTRLCATCEDRTVHRRLTALDAVNAAFNRVQMPAAFRKRVLTVFQNQEAITLQTLESQNLEVDHRFPQVRWSEPEEIDINMTDAEIRQTFQLLTRQNNLWKSRYCENCAATGRRGTFIGIEYFYEGNEVWDPNIPNDDERGCEGCFWYKPEVWRASLNELIEKEKE